jgi:hypothetical protein
MSVNLIGKTLFCSLHLIGRKTLKMIHLREKKVGLVALPLIAGLLILSFYLLKRCCFSAKVESEKYNKQKLITQIKKGNHKALARAADDLVDEEGKIDDLDVMRVAVQEPKKGWTLVYASPRLRNHDELVELAVANDSTSRALLVSAIRFHYNRKLVEKTLMQCPSALVWLFHCQNDKEMVKIAIENEQAENRAGSISECEKETSEEKEGRCVFVNANQGIRDNLEMAKFAIERNRRAYFFISERLKKLPEVKALVGAV